MGTGETSMNRLTMLTIIVAVSAPLALSQDRLTVPFRNPSQPRKLIVDTMMGTVTVKGYDGQEAIVEGSGRGSVWGIAGKQIEPPPGMHRIGGTTGGLEVTEDNNTVKVSAASVIFTMPTNVVIQVPTQTSVTVNTAFGSSIVIENISGQIEATNMNGQVSITNASGSVVAHSMNGKIVVSLNSVMPDKAMSFSTMNGDVDVTLPASIKANVKMKTDRGEMFTDFDIKLDSTAKPPAVEDNRA